MFLETVVEALQSSSLAPLFIDISAVRVQELPDKSSSKHIAALSIRSLFPSDDGQFDKFLLFETERGWFFSIPKLATNRSEVGLIRAAQVNGMAHLGRVTWDVETGDIGVEWILNKRADTPPSLVEFEYVIASLLLYYFQEKLWFVAASLAKQPSMIQGAMKPLLDEAERLAKEEVLPAILQVLR